MREFPKKKAIEKRPEGGAYNEKDDAQLQSKPSINEIIDSAIRAKKDKFYKGHSQKEIDEALRLTRQKTGENKED